jgi:hypothetical protein
VLDLGDTYVLAADCVNAAGALANATTVTLVVTLPDGTTAPQAPTNPPAVTGKYTHSYVTTVAGRHVARWTFTGGVPQQAYAEVFDVEETAALLSLAAAKKRLKIPVTDTSVDEELREMIETATGVCEFYAGALVRRTVTERHSASQGTTQLVLRKRPVISITSATESGVAVPSTGYSLSDTGILTRVSGYEPQWWEPGIDNITVVYVPGRTVIPPTAIEAGKELVRINSRPILGGNYSPFDGGSSDDYGSDGGEFRFGFFVPNRIMMLLETMNTGPTVG